MSRLVQILDAVPGMKLMNKDPREECYLFLEMWCRSVGGAVKDRERAQHTFLDRNGKYFRAAMGVAAEQLPLMGEELEGQVDLFFLEVFFNEEIFEDRKTEARKLRYPNPISIFIDLADDHFSLIAPAF